MKKAILILALAALLAGCASSPAPAASIPETTVLETSTAETESTAAEIPETTAASVPLETLEQTLPLTYTAYQVVYNIMTEGGEESAVFQGIDPNGSLVWTYETGSYPMAQLSRITPLASFQDVYYLVEGGKVVALDIATGEIRFENPEFMGCPAPDAFFIDEYGYLCLAGYDGPDFFLMDPQGHTLRRGLPEDTPYCMPYEITREEDQIVIHMESDGQGNSGDFPVYVPMDWIPQAMG